MKKETQKEISDVILFIAGCGIGSTIAEAAVRMGFQNFFLADGDTVSYSNLNRQAFVFNDIGVKKVHALAQRMREINPDVKIMEYPENLNEESIHTLVPLCDIICDTIDFLDLSAILCLHDYAKKFNKPLISAVGAGWGAAAFYIPKSDQAAELGELSLIRQLFNVMPGEENTKPYSEVFSVFFHGIAKHLDPSIVSVMTNTFVLMEDGKPCPASQVVGGSYAVASLTMTVLHQILSEGEIKPAPYLFLVDNLGAVKHPKINLLNSMEELENSRAQKLGRKTDFSVEVNEKNN